MPALNRTILCTAQGGNFTSTIASREISYSANNPGAVVIASTAGATPTVTVNLQGSADGVNFFNIGYSLVATPTTVTVAAIVITTTVTTTYILAPSQPWQFFQLVASANTNVTLTASAYI